MTFARREAGTGGPVGGAVLAKLTTLEAPPPEVPGLRRIAPRGEDKPAYPYSLRTGKVGLNAFLHEES
jgi:hypothetical protein